MGKIKVITIDTRIGSRVRALDVEGIRRVVSLHPSYAFIYECLDLLTISPQALLFLSSQNYTPRKYNLRFISYCKIMNKDWFFKHDRKTGRIFNNITSLPSELRQFLRLDGRKIAEVDIGTSQPLFLFKHYDNIKITGRGYYKKFTQKDFDSERKLYKGIIQSGNFYEELNRLLKKPYPIADRGKLKKKIYQQVFFGRITKRKPLLKVFKNRFPVLFLRVKKTKGIGIGKVEKANAYKRLALQLQKREAEIMFDRIVERIRKKHKSIKLLTIHDSILCQTRHKNIIKRIMEQQIKAAIGVKPTIKIK